MTPTPHQQEAIGKLLATTHALLSLGGSRVCVFKAPTGGGKTIMMADFLRQFAESEHAGRYAFLWISSHDLHRQSRDKLAHYLGDSRYSFTLLEELAGDRFEENQIAFVNWESLTKQDRQTGDFTSVLMRENEEGRNLPTLVANTKEAGLAVILVIDESQYYYWTKRSQELVNQVIGPALTIEVSATPKVVPESEAIATGAAGFVSLSFEDVVEDELIKRSAVVNEAIGTYAEFRGTADEAVIEAALAKRAELAALFAKEGADVNPLLLVQLPSESRDTTALDQSKLETVERTLADEHGITVENGKLAVWLTNRKDNLADITKNDSQVEVLVFKQAIAFGWDCPRSHVLVMFKDIRSPIFEIQTVGRIMRMPEVRHYETEVLNQAYVYTNLDRVEVGADGTSKGYFKMHRAVARNGTEPVTLPSVYLSRVDYGDLTLSFRALFAEEADKQFGIEPTDTPAKAKDKADVALELLPGELARPVITDVVLENIDTLTKQEILGETVVFDVSPDDIKRAYTAFAKATSLPFAPVRSHTKIQQAFYDWFDKRLGYAGQSRIEIQRIVVCSEENQRIFREVIERAKARFKEVRKREIEATERRKEYGWSVPVVDYFTDEYVPVPAKRSALVSAAKPEATLLKEKRSQPEQQFEALLERPESPVAWWYKNGDRGETYFAIPYVDPETGLEASFYPDYIVRFTDGSIGIYDPKDGATRSAPETFVKSDALQAYIRAHKTLRLRGGIVWKTPGGWRIFTQPAYSLAEGQWDLLSFEAPSS